MNLIPWRRKDEDSKLGQPADLFRRQLDHLFDDFFGNWPLSHWSGADFVPQLEVSEDEKEITVAAELPGLSEKEVEVSLSDGRLLISGQKKDEREEKEKSYHLVERSYGSFSRSIEVGPVDEGKIEASFKNGVLTVKLPKREEAKPRKVDIKVK